MMTTSGFLHDSEPAAFETVNPDGTGSLLLVCDHASSRVPARLGNLGLTEQQLNSHIGWDPGAAAVARRLSARLDAPLIMSNYSRLVIDCNRWPAAADSIPVTSGGVVIPGNAELSADELLWRRLSLFEPYQAEIDAHLSKPSEQLRFLLSIHSFTPSLFGIDRPWSIGVCYREDVLLARHWLDALQTTINTRDTTTPELIGDNEPYVVEAGSDYTIPTQGESRGIASIMLEIRQDKIQDQPGIDFWSDIIAESWLRMQPR